MCTAHPWQLHGSPCRRVDLPPPGRRRAVPTAGGAPGWHLRGRCRCTAAREADAPAPAVHRPGTAVHGAVRARITPHIHRGEVAPLPCSYRRTSARVFSACPWETCSAPYDSAHDPCRKEGYRATRSAGGRTSGRRHCRMSHVRAGGDDAAVGQHHPVPQDARGVRYADHRSGGQHPAARCDALREVPPRVGHPLQGGRHRAVPRVLPPLPRPLRLPHRQPSRRRHQADGPGPAAACRPIRSP